MPAMDKLQRVANVKTASNWAPKSEKQTPEQTPYKIQMMEGSTLKKKPTFGEPIA